MKKKRAKKPLIKTTRKTIERVGRYVNIQKNRYELSRKGSLLFYGSGEWKLLKRWVYGTYERECFRCRAKDTELHVDHIVPISVNPEKSTNFSNLQILCKECNLLKSNKNLEKYRPILKEERIYICSDQMLELKKRWDRFFPLKPKKEKKIKIFKPKEQRVLEKNMKTKKKEIERDIRSPRVILRKKTTVAIKSI